MSQFADNIRPMGYAVPPAERTGRGPYHKGKGTDKGTFKGKDKSLTDWPPLNQRPPKGFPKGFPQDIPKGLPKGPDKGKSFGKGVAPPPVFAPAANPSRPGPP